MKISTKKVKKKREQSKLSRVLASSKHQYIVHRNFFDKLDAGEIRDSVKSLAQHIHFRNAIQLKHNPFKEKYRKHTPDTSLVKNIAWCLGIVELFKVELQEFLDHEDVIQRCILEENYEKAFRQLDRVDEVCGISFWSIGIRSTLLSISGEKEKKQSLLTDKMGESETNGFLKSITRIIINKYEESDGVSSESSFTEQKIKRTYSGATLHFLMYKAVPMNNEFAYDYNEILNIEKHSSPVDIIVCLIDFATYANCGMHGSVYENDAHKICKSLNKIFSSDYISALGVTFGIEYSWGKLFDECDILEDYTRGNYDAIVNRKNLKDRLVRFSDFEVVCGAACRARHKVEGFLGELINAACSLILKDEDFERSAAYLSLLTNSLGKLPWFRLMQLLILRETKFTTEEADFTLARAQALLADVNSHRKVRFLPEILRTNYIAAIAPGNRYTALHNLFIPNDEEDCEDSSLGEVDKARAMKYVAVDLYNKDKPSEAIRLLKDLIALSDQVISQAAVKLLILSHLKAADIQTAIDLYVKMALDNPRLLKTLDSNAICLAGEKLIENSRTLEISIALSIHNRFVESNYTAALRYAFERYLHNNKIENPIEIFEIDTPDTEKLYYFAEHVCTPENMKLYLYFETARDVEICRIEICKRLVKAGRSLELMVPEIKERTRKIVLHDAAKHVESSKIYSDTSSFLTSTELNHLYTRYQKMCDDEIAKPPDQIELESFVDGVKSDKEIINNAHIVHIQSLVLGERNSLFFKLMKLMRDEFTYGAKGLGGFLSTRIKHGHFPNTLRKCAADENLLSRKVNSTGGYKKNLVWIDKLGPLSADQQGIVDKALTEFSSKFDDLINKANDKWLNITIVDQDVAGLSLDETENEALFNYSITYLSAHLLSVGLPPATSYQDFVRYVSDWLWGRTEANLERVRSKLSKEFRDEAFRRVDKLEKDIMDCVRDESKLSQFQESLVRLRQRLATSVDTVIGWFERSQGLAVPQFDSEIAMRIACISADAKIDYKDHTQVQFQGRALTYIVDVLYVILENCVTKSNLSKDNLMINGVLHLDGEDAVLLIENNCTPVGDYMLANANLGPYRDRYGKESYMLPASRTQGGTGLAKIWKALAKDLDLSHSIEFGYSSSSSFRIELVIHKIAKVIQQ
ncbi:hypothetical protein [Pseudomonas viridiflava]|uniref:hypothetical protein n=8 Tax=Pseudomonas viridiflava TaxID=33069 RepID=UPI000F01B561|nr:hypothetical protein [Pseudomonas viridiflava]